MRRTHALVQVSMALMADASGRHWGYELSKQSGVRSGVMYPILNRMLHERWLSDGWEDGCDHKRPPRRYYQLTESGKLTLGALIAEAQREARFRPLFAPQSVVRGAN